MSRRPRLLQTEAMSVSIGSVPLLHDISVGVDAGEVLGLVGASGAGKSLTALAVARLLPPGAAMAGKVLLEGRDLVAHSEAQMRGIRGRDIGMVFQDPMSALNPLMSIGAQVAETVRAARRRLDGGKPGGWRVRPWTGWRSAARREIPRRASA